MPAAAALALDTFQANHANDDLWDVMTFADMVENWHLSTPEEECFKAALELEGLGLLTVSTGFLCYSVELTGLGREASQIFHQRFLDRVKAQNPDFDGVW